MALTHVQSQYRRGVLAKLAAGHYTLEDIPVCLCGSAGSSQIAANDRFGIPVGVVVCTRCGLARTTPRLAARHLEEFYEEEYHPLHLSVKDPDPGVPLYRAVTGASIADIVADSLPDGPLRVADIGCGTGLVVRELAAALPEREIRSAGCEYAVSYVEAGRRAGTDVRHGGPETLTDLAPFDLVILSHVVEHFPDPVADLAAVRALGNEETLFYVEVPGLLTIDRKAEYAYRLDQYITLAHTYHFTLGTLTQAMGRAGFSGVWGDEAVRSIYRIGPFAEPTPDPAMASRIEASLAELNGWRMRVRRMRPMLRQLAAAMARRLPEPIFYRTRRLIRSR